MPFNIYDTHTLYGAIQLMKSQTRFLKERYFPTTGVFATNDILVDIRDAQNKLAPFVVRKKHGETYDRIGYKTNQYTPPYIAPRMAITIDDIERRGFGEALYTQMTPEERAMQYIRDDVETLDKMITRREELMCAEIMFNGKLTMQQYADDNDAPIEAELKYYEGSSNPAIYTPSSKWDTSSAKIVEDIATMVRMLRRIENGATDLIVGADVANVMLANEDIRKLLDNRRFFAGEVNPQLSEWGVEALGYINTTGNAIGVYCYDFYYTDSAGNSQPFIPAKKVVLTAPNAGQTLYGAVTQMEEEDRQLHTRVGARIPKVVSNVDNNVRTLTLSACPLMAPRSKSPFISATVLS